MGCESSAVLLSLALLVKQSKQVTETGVCLFCRLHQAGGGLFTRLGRSRGCAVRGMLATHTYFCRQSLLPTVNRLYSETLFFEMVLKWSVLFFFFFLPPAFLSFPASELWVVHPAIFPLPSVAAIFSGVLKREAENFATAPLVSQMLPPWQRCEYRW